MSSMAKGVVSMKLVAASEETTQKISETKLPSSFEVVASPSSGQSKLNASSIFLYPVQETVDTKSKKRTRPKPGPRSRKKGKIGNSTDAADEETLDTDLVAIVESLDTDKNLDSDSSTNTIILDDVNNQTSNNSAEEIAESKLSGVNALDKRTKSVVGQSLLKNMIFQPVKANISPLSTNPFSVPSSKKEEYIKRGTEEIYTNFYNNSKGKVIFTRVPPPFSGNQTPSLSLLTPMKKNEVSQLGISLLREANNHNRIPVSSVTSSPQPILRSLMTDNYSSIDSPLTKTYPYKAQNKATKIVFGAQATDVKGTPPQSSVNATCLLVPNLCQTAQKVNTQSLYASMGLDEDLCDSDQKFLKSSANSASKESQSSTLHNPLKYNPLNVPIKVEKDESPSFIVGCNTNENRLLFDSKNETLLSNDLHVSMTFEAEPSEGEDLEEDDLPLSILKNQISCDDIAPKLKQKSEELNNYISENVNDIHPSLFIKKELIEDEIVSESQAVSSKNLLTVSNAKCSTEVQTSSASQNDFMNIKIKKEPDTDFSFSECVSKNISSASVSSNVTQVSKKTTGLVSNICLENNQNNVLEPARSKNTNPFYSAFENTVSPNAYSCVSKAEVVDRLNAYNVSPLASDPCSDFNGNNNNVNSNSIENVPGTCIAVNKKSKKIGKSNKKKSRTKNTKLTTENVLDNSPSVSFGPDKSLCKEVQQDFKSYDDNSDMSSCQHVTDTDTESNSSKKKSKRKKGSKSVDIDENLPITLLIKRQKVDNVDESAPDSFLCTSVSKSGAGESKSISAMLTSDKSHLKDKNTINQVDNILSDVSLHSQNLVHQQKTSKKQRKQSLKRQTKKQAKKTVSSSNTSSEAVQSENRFSPSLNIPINVNDNSHANYSQSNLIRTENSELACQTKPSKSLDHQIVNRPPQSCQTSASRAEQKCETYVYMTFEEQLSPIEENSEEDKKSVLCIKKEKDVSPPRDMSSEILSIVKNIKQEKKNSVLSESKALEELSNTSVSCDNSGSPVSSQMEETQSTVISVASNSNVEDDSSKSALSNILVDNTDNTVADLNLNVAKKKKKRPRSYGWYKKKKSRSRDKKLSPVTVEMKEPTLEASSSLSAIKKLTPVTVEMEEPTLEASSSLSAIKKFSPVTVEMKEPTLEASSSLPGITSNKVPRVIIKKFQQEIKPVDGEGKVMEKNLSVCPEQEPVKMPIRSKKKKGSSCKRKRKRTTQLVESTSNKTASQNTVLEDNSKLSENHLQSESQLPKGANFGNNLLSDTSECEPSKSCENHVTISDNAYNSDQTNTVHKVRSIDNLLHPNIVNSRTEKSRSTVFPSLDVDQIRQEIAACEAILQNESSSDKSRLSASGYESNKELMNVESAVSEPNMLEAFNSSFKSVKSKCVNSFESFADVQIKKEPDDYGKSSIYSSDQVSSISSNCFSKNNQLDDCSRSSQMSTSEKESMSGRKELSVQNANSDLLSANLSGIKKERNTDCSVLNNLAMVESSSRSVLNTNICQRDKLIKSVANASLLQSETLMKSAAQNSPLVDIDKIALSIKKEVYGDAKSRSSNHGIKDQDDLIRKTCGNLIISSHSSKAKSICSMQLSSSGSLLQGNKGYDDEIEILQIADQKSSEDVPFVDLTDENCTPGSAVEIQEIVTDRKATQDYSMLVSTSQENATQKSTTQVSTAEGSGTHVSTPQDNTMQLSISQFNLENASNELIQPIKAVKTGNSSLKDSFVSTSVSDTKLKEKLSVITKKEESSLSSDVGDVHNEFELFNSKGDVLKPYFIRENDEKDVPIKIEIFNSLISREKYFEEYFKHSFPPSVVSYNTSHKNRSKMYSRIKSKAWNLSIEEVESRLKRSENIIPQFGKKLGDVVRLEKYPVSNSEVECYHRILGVAPSHKLLSKCFKSPDKKINTIINSGFTDVQQMNVNKFETDKQFNQMNLSLDDIFKGIAETKMMYSNTNKKNNIAVYERDCPSTDTRDSCDSHISSVSTTNQNRDLKTSSNLNQVKENEFVCGSTLTDTNSHDKSSALSGRLSDCNDAIKSDLSNQSFTTQKPSEAQFVNNIKASENINPLPAQDALNYLNLPSQEVINNIVNNADSSSSCVGTSGNINMSNSFPRLKSNTPVCSESYSSSNSCHSSHVNADIKVNDESKLQSEKKQAFNIIDVPVTELRKILETAGNLCSDMVNYDNGALWKSEATFEYNHTRSIPVEMNSKYNNLGVKGFSSIAPFNNLVSHSTPRDHANTASESTCSTVPEGSDLVKNTMQEDSDNDYVDNEPIHNDDSRDESISEKHVTEERPAPQYKSKWEKIIARKSSGSNEREGVNEYLLRDCFPVSRTGIRNKNNTSNKNVSKSFEKPECSAEKQNKKGKKNLVEKNVKNNDKSNSKANVLQQNNKSAKKSVAKEEKDKTVAKEEKNKTVAKEEKNITKSNIEKKAKNVSKKSKVKVDDVSNLFVPDKPVEISKIKKTDTNVKSGDDRSKRFYGNRVTNRGTFLTESSSPSELLKKIKIPKKKTSEVAKKPVNVHELHSKIKSPDINIELTFRSSYKNSNKSLESRKHSECYRSPLENTSSSVSSHFIRTKQMRDRKMFLSNSRQQLKMQKEKNLIFVPLQSRVPHNLCNENVMSRKTPLLSTPSNISPLINEDNSLNRRTLLNIPSSIPLHISDESTLNRQSPLLNTPSSISSHHSEDGNIMDTNIPLLGLSPSFSSQHSSDESLLGRNIPTLITQTSISPQIPSKSFPSNVNPNMNLLESIISAINSSKTSAPEVDDTLPFSEHVNSAWDKSELNSSIRHSMNVQPMMPGESINKSYGNIPLPELFDPLKSSTRPISNIPLKNQFDSPFDSSDILNSPPFSTSVNTSTQIASQPNRKAACLVPHDLKTLVGHKIIDTYNVRLLMLEWSVDWLVQQQQFHDPPPISNALKKVVSTYDSFDDYYNTYFPLMLLDTWHRIYVSWTHLNQASPYSCQITSYSVKNHYISVECQTVFNTAAHPKGVFPDEGSILMVKYSTKSNEYTIKILGYVTHVKTRRFNSVTDSKLFSSLRVYKDANPDVLQILTLTFMGAYNSEDIDKRQPIRIHVLCNVKPTLKQNDAMLHIKQSPLQRSILNPCADGLLSFTLTARNSPLEKVNECVRDITKGILSPHPLPLLTVVRAKPESDRLNIIPMLIEKMKSAYKTKVLLCVRTVRALGDIAANICLHQSLKLVIINKRCDTNPQFQKYLLDEIANAEISKMAEDKGEKLHVKTEVAVKFKKQVLKECDVVLSLIRNCHDEFIGETFAETDCVSQMCCIVDEANLCTEPETLIPILHGISKLILIGDPEYPAKVLSKTASAYDYSQSFFQRAYDLDLITE